MALNVKYIVSIVGILKLVSIVLLIIAHSIGMHAFLNSEYNKNYSEGKTSASPTSNTRTTTARTTPTISSRNEVIIVDSTTNETLEDTDLAPILWMERFHLIATGTCVLFAVAYFLVHLFKDDLTENKTARGIDFGFHFIGTIWLIISAIFMAYSGLTIHDLSEELCNGQETCQLLKEKLTAAGLAFLAALVFFAICLKTFGRKLYQTV